MKKTIARQRSIGPLGARSRKRRVNKQLSLPLATHQDTSAFYNQIQQSNAGRRRLITPIALVSSR